MMSNSPGAAIGHLPAAGDISSGRRPISASSRVVGVRQYPIHLRDVSRIRPLWLLSGGSKHARKSLSGPPTVIVAARLLAVLIGCYPFYFVIGNPSHWLGSQTCTVKVEVS
jgi:hypothetical protein